LPTVKQGATGTTDCEGWKLSSLDVAAKQRCITTQKPQTTTILAQNREQPTQQLRNSFICRKQKALSSILPPLYSFVQVSSMCQTSSSSSQIVSPISRWDATHKAVIHAPINIVWESLVDTASWQWNPCVRLSADVILTGTVGKASISAGYRRWKIKDFTFDSVSRETFTFSWTVSVGTCKVTNTMRLMPTGAKTTKISHSQKFSGVFHGLRWQLPLQKMKNHPVCISEALKNHVESRHFKQLLVTLSTREMSTASDFTVSTEIHESSPLGASYWESSPRFRKQLLSTFLGDEKLSISEL
jgi:hypothetical protein